MNHNDCLCFTYLIFDVLRKGSKQNLFELMRFPQIRFIAQKLNEIEIVNPTVLAYFLFELRQSIAIFH